MPDSAVSASAKGATYLIILQISTRALTFALNQLLLRHLSPTILGLSIQLELFKIGVQYFSRESLRVAAERRSDGGIQASINLSYLAILANIPLGFVFAGWYLGIGAGVDVPYFTEALRVNQLAAFLELGMEPAFTAVQQNMLYKARAAAEGSSVILKTVTVFSLFFWANKNGLDIGVLPFAAGEIVNSITRTTVYWAWTIPLARSNAFSLFPRRMKSSPQIQYLFSLFSKPLLWLISSLFFQTGIKWLLTEGDKLLIATLASLEDQGMYALSANYGGLIARMLFQPIENSSRNLFANLCSAPSQQFKKPDDKISSAQAEGTTKDNLRTALQTLTLLLKTYNLLSLPVLTLGPPMAPLLLRLVAGSRWSDSGAGQVLGTYCYYIPFLALNGVSEAFVAATASTKDLRNQSFWMGANFLVFATSAWALLRVRQTGAEGLVVANCVNMGLRVGFNLWYIVGYFRDRGLTFDVRDILPSAYAIAAAAVMPAVISQTRHSVSFLEHYGVLGELVRIAALAIPFIVIVALAERKFLLESWRKFRS